MPAIKDKQALIEWQTYTRNLARVTPIDLNESSADKEIRKAKLLKDFTAFCKYYFPQYFQSEFADFHKKFAKEVIDNPTIFITRAWARDHAKSVVSSVMLPLFLKFNGELKNMLLVSYNKDNAEELLKPLRLQLEANQRIINDFGKQRSLNMWESGKFVTTDGCSFRAIGSGQNPRGTREEEARPDYILFDDIDDDEVCRNPKRLDDRWDWVMGALFACLSIDKSKRFIGVGNIIAKDSIIKRASTVSDSHQQINLLRKRKTVDTELLQQLQKELKELTDTNKIKLYNEAMGYVKDGYEPSWRQRFHILDCVYMMSKMGYRLAQREYFNNPISEGKIFKKDWFVFAKIPRVSGIKFKVAYLDPGFKKTKTSDTKAWVLVGLHDGKYYIVKVFCDRASINEMIEWGYEFDAYLKREKTSAPMLMEEVFLQDLLYKDFAEIAKSKGYPLPLRGDRRKKPDKDERIMATSGHFERGNVILNEAEQHNHHMQNLVEQFLNFEPGVKTLKDGCDAVEGAMKELESMVTLNQDWSVTARAGNTKRV